MPGETKRITINNPPGAYASDSDLPGQLQAGMVGTLIVVSATPTP